MLRLSFLALVAVAAAAPRSAGCAALGEAPVYSRDGIEVSILPTIAAAKGAHVAPALLDIEANTDAAVTRLGFRSLLATTEIDCAKGVNRFTRATAYAEPGLKGQGESRSVGGAWQQPAAESFMAAVTARVCAAAARPDGPAMQVTEAAPAPAAAAPAEQSPPAVAMPPHEDASIVRPPPAQAAKPPGHGVPAAAQVAASSTAKGAQRVLNQLKGLIAAPLAGVVEPATVNGAQVYRASVTGFASAAEAKAFCARAADVSKTCWVRLLPKNR